MFDVRKSIKEFIKKSRTLILVNYVPGLVLTVGATLVVSLLNVEEKALSWRLQMREILNADFEGSRSQEVVIVAIDDLSVQSLQRHVPLPRDYLGELVTKISECEPAAIGIDFDLCFLSDTPEEDEALAEALLQSRNCVLASQLTGPASQTEVNPIPRLVDPGGGLWGYANIAEKSERMTRKASLTTTLDNNSVAPSFSLALALQSLSLERLHRHEVSRVLGELRGSSGNTRDSSATHSSVQRLMIAPGRLATQPVINFTGDGGRGFPIYPAAYVQAGKIPSAWLQDKTVLIGGTYREAGDHFFTPLSRSKNVEDSIPGVLLHANIVANLLEAGLLYFPHWIVTALLIIGAAILGLLFAFVRQRSIQWIAPLIILLYWAISFVHVVWNGRTLLPLQVVTIVFLFASIIGLGAQVWRARANRDLSEHEEVPA